MGIFYKAKFNDNGDKFCNYCKQFKSITEFKTVKSRHGRSILHAYCNICHIVVTKQSQLNFKLECLDFLGGRQCSQCKYNKCIGALEFHHLDITNKDFTIGKFKYKHINDLVKSELVKCIVLCANCHREKHYTQ